MSQLIGEESRLSVLKNKDVKLIKKLLVKGLSQRSIALKFNVHYSLISHIKAGRRWSHIK